VRAVDQLGAEAFAALRVDLVPGTLEIGLGSRER